MTGRDKKIPILMYHEIYRPEDHDLLSKLTNPVYNTELSLFHRQMAWLFKNQFNTLIIDELVQQKKNLAEKAVCLTFDDGWLGNYLYAFPILKEFRFKATFFVATDLIGRPFYMTWDHLKEMLSDRMSIQSHTITHQPLARMREKEIRFELLESKKAIEEELGSEVSHLSLPHGSKNKMTWPIAKGIGYKSICTSDVGFQAPQNNGSWLKRINIGDGISLNQFQLIASGNSRAILSMMVIKRLKNILRGMVGTKNYRKLYKRIYAIRG